MIIETALDYKSGRLQEESDMAVLKHSILLAVWER